MVPADSSTASTRGTAAKRSRSTRRARATIPGSRFGRTTLMYSGPRAVGTIRTARLPGR